MTALKKPGRTGRPPSGPKGEKVSEYQQLTIRLPAKTRVLLEDVRGATGMPIWRLIDQAVRRYVRALPQGERRLASHTRQRLHD